MTSLTVFVPPPCRLREVTTRRIRLLESPPRDCLVDWLRAILLTMETLSSRRTSSRHVYNISPRDVAYDTNQLVNLSVSAVIPISNPHVW